MLGMMPRETLEHSQRFAASWRHTPFAERARLVDRLATLLGDHGEHLAESMAREIGKPIRFGRVEVQRTAQKLRAVIQHAKAPNRLLPGVQVRRRPHGVVAVITPYNNPIYLALGKIAPAIVYGNAVVWKPAPEAAALSRRLHDLLGQTGFPADLVRLCEGGREAAAALMNDAAVAAVTITGSSAAGETAQEICGRRRIPLQAELGGNNAAIVWTDANLVDAARAVAAGAFDMAGQRCTANRRVIVHESCRQHFLELLQRETAALPMGDPQNPETRIGPLVSIRHCERVAGMVERGKSVGRAFQPVIKLNDSVESLTYFPPTIICCDNADAEIVQQETFGPVLVVQTAVGWEHAIRLCNGVRQGLAAAVFSHTPRVVERFLDEAEAGILKVNQSTADAAVDVPFGGWKASGLGLPEHGVFDQEFYTRAQTVYL